VREKIIPLFVTAAIAEACSWAGLLAGMAVKYGPPGNEIGVRVFGPVHGALFVAYGLLVLVVARYRRWSLWHTAVALACAVPPFATVLFERWARRRGLLGTPAPAERPLSPVG
jgi:integral membrane protein